MSKQQDHLNDRIPTYEESIANDTPSSITPSGKTPARLSIQQRNRLKRTRLVNDLTTVHLEPAITRHLEDGINKTTTILLPSDSFPSSITITSANVTSPALPSNITLLSLTTEDDKASFLHQPAVIQDLASAIASILVDPSSLQNPVLAPEQLTMLPLPARSQPQQQRSPFKYMLGMPGPEKDPTGSTGKWNLGWRGEEDPASTTAVVNTDGIMVTVRLRDISFRIENEMGLLESKSVKCVWCEVELKS